MTTLDCENIYFLRSSLQSITGIKIGECESFLRSFDIYDFYDKHPDFMYPEDVFVFLLKNKFKTNINHDKTCWFHITRSKRDNSFSKGILPLNAIIDDIWDELFYLLKNQIQKDEWKRFKHFVQTNFKHSNASLYRDIMIESSNWGPYGFLAKNLDCFDQNFSTWHYFDCPEIILDICKCANEFLKIDLLKLYQQSTLPCVVKFEYVDHDIKHIGNALSYLYAIIKGEKLSRDDNVCFSTRGKMIVPNCIKDIQFYYG